MFVNHKGASYRRTVEILEQSCLKVCNTYKYSRGGYRWPDIKYQFLINMMMYSILLRTRTLFLTTPERCILWKHLMYYWDKKLLLWFIFISFELFGVLLLIDQLDLNYIKFV